MLFSSKNINYYIFSIIIIVTVSFFANKWKETLHSNEGDELIRKYLMNDTPHYSVENTSSKGTYSAGDSRPKLWIHTLHDRNARKWKDFYSRNTTDINQPYMHLTIKSIVDHCGKDFNICMIDDDAFKMLLPSWEIDMSTTPEPMRSRYRQLGILELVYLYGGMVLPSSFLCLKNMKDFYTENTEGNHVFVCENINRSEGMKINKKKLVFSPDLYIMGAPKENKTVFDIILYLKEKYKNVHFSSENEFLNDTSFLCNQAIQAGKMKLVGGEMVGVKTNKRKKILLENLLEEDYLDLHRNAVGIYIPMNEVLERTKYQWFAVLPSEQILKSKMIISKYFKASMIDTDDEYKKITEIKSNVHI